MANLKEIRIRINSVTNTRQVTSAMKMVSAAKLRKAQEAIMKIKPYAEKMQEIVQTVSGSLSDNFDSPLFTSRQNLKTLIILVSSNKGLCGVYNSSITRLAVDWVKENRLNELNEGNLKFYCVGRKGYEILSKMKMPILGREDNLLHKPSFGFSAYFIQRTVKLFLNKEFDEVVVFYNSFKNAASQYPTVESFLPISIKNDDSKINADFILEPNPDTILNDLAPKMLEIQFHKIILDAIAADHGARMTAMHKATDNASDLISSLKLTYNKARQESITNEILEIVSGANALQG